MLKVSKAPFWMTLLLLAGGGWFAWSGHERLTILRERHAFLLEKSKTIDPSLSAYSRPSTSAISKKGALGNAASLEAGLISCLIKLKAAPDDQELQKRHLDLIDQLYSLPVMELKEIILHVQERSDLQESEQVLVAYACVLVMMSYHPAELLAAYVENPDYLKSVTAMRDTAISVTLGYWAQQDPLKAFRWAKGQASTHPEAFTQQARSSLLKGTATKDVSLAFQLMDDLQLSPVDTDSLTTLGNAARSAEAQTELLGRFRELANMESIDPLVDFREQGWRSLFESVIAGGYESAAQWVDAANLSKYERDCFIEALIYAQLRKDKDQWNEWLARQPN